VTVGIAPIEAMRPAGMRGEIRFLDLTLADTFVNP
jgi:hypothetical protein